MTVKLMIGVWFLIILILRGFRLDKVDIFVFGYEFIKIKH